MLDKAVIAVGCLAALVTLPVDIPFVAALLLAIAVAALCEALGSRARLALIGAYLVAALAFPICTAPLGIVAYECMRDRRAWVRPIWVAPLVAAIPRFPLEALAVSAIMCAVAGALALRTATLARERNRFHVLRDTVREQAIALEVHNRELMGTVAELQADESANQRQVPESYSREAFPSLLFANLTERELEIAAHVAKGLDNREIATAVFAGEGTVRNHISSILQKTGLRNRTQIAIAYLEQAN